MQHYETSSPLAVHVVFGYEIGFWDKRVGHTNHDWQRILALASQDITDAMIDVLGDRIQLVNTVNAFRQYCSSDIENLMMWHDSIMSIEYRMMGFVGFYYIA